MITLPKRKSTFNFYESFSDLVFCALVMFLVLVLFLAMNVNQKQEEVETTQKDLTQTTAQIEEAKKQAQAELAERIRLREEAKVVFDKEMARVEAERARLIADAQKKIKADRARFELMREDAEKTLKIRRKALALMEREIERQMRLYKQALGTNRYTGLPSRPRLVIAYDWQPNRISVHLLPAWFVDELNTEPPDLTPQARAEYDTKLRERFKVLSEQVEPLTPRQYRALFRSVSVGIEPAPLVGRDRRVSLDLAFTVDDAGRLTTKVDAVIPGGNGQAAGLKAGDVLISIDNQSITPATLPKLLAGYKPGDKARLLVQRGRKPTVLDLVFRELRVVDLEEQFRPDLSMVASGAKDTDYTDLWEKARSEALRRDLKQGQAGRAVWQTEGRWAGRSADKGRPVLRFDSKRRSDEVIIGGEAFSIPQFRRVLEALGGGGIVVEYQGKLGQEDLPKALYEKALRPTGFVIRAPQLEKLLKAPQ